MGSGTNNGLFGLEGNDNLFGLDGNDVLDGGAGVDTMRGDVGDDVLIVDNVDDVVIERANEGIDPVDSDITYVLPTQVENLALLGSTHIDGHGNSRDNVLNGQFGNNFLYGSGGSDRLLGYAGDDFLVGGSERDTLEGGAGNDEYGLSDASVYFQGFYRSGYDKIVEAANGGIDLVEVGRQLDPLTSGLYFTSYQLGDNLENARVTGSEDFDLRGNELDNGLTGNAAANLLAGRAGADLIDGRAGHDTLDGGAGNDTYTLGEASIYFQNFYRSGYDKVSEANNGGIDLVEVGRQLDPLTSGLFFTGYELGANIENARITGSGDFNIEGNAADNSIIGNNAVNQISGGNGVGDGNDAIYGNGGDDFLNGRAGADTVYGGAGNDLITVNAVADKVVELANQGIDRIDASVSWTLTANCENPVLLGFTHIDGVGNGLANSISGNFGNNELSGSGGNDLLYGAPGADRLAGNLGSDLLVGDDGDDRFIFNLISDSRPDGGQPAMSSRTSPSVTA